MPKEEVKIKLCNQINKVSKMDGVYHRLKIESTCSNNFLTIKPRKNYNNNKTNNSKLNRKKKNKTIYNQ